jgi:hypothetical protein
MNEKMYTDSTEHSKTGLKEHNRTRTDTIINDTMQAHCELVGGSRSAASVEGGRENDVRCEFTLCEAIRRMTTTDIPTILDPPNDVRGLC